MIIDIKVIPQSRKNSFVEFKMGVLKIKIKGTPIKGKVNANLIEFLADSLNISKRSIRILSGLTSKRKKIEILDADTALLLLSDITSKDDKVEDY